MDIQALLVWLIVGAFGLIGNIVVGIIGSLIAGWLLPKIGVERN